MEVLIRVARFVVPGRRVSWTVQRRRAGKHTSSTHGTAERGRDGWQASKEDDFVPAAQKGGQGDGKSG